MMISSAIKPAIILDRDIRQRVPVRAGLPILASGKQSPLAISMGAKESKSKHTASHADKGLGLCRLGMLD